MESSPKTTGKPHSRLVPFSIVLVGVVVYSVVYSYITVAKFNAFNATIFDLGVNASMLYNVFHSGVSIIPGSPNFINTGKMIYLVLAPFYNLYPHEQVLLVFQSVWIALGSIPIYFLAKRKVKDEFIAVAFSIIWLLYYPMAGVNWFDFHLMALFPTFFISGIAALEYEKRKLAFVLLFLATITDFLIPLVMILFGLGLLFKDYRAGKYLRKDHLAIALVIVSVVILFTTNFLFGISYTAAYAYNSAVTVSAFRSDNSQIMLYFVRILLPLGFVSVLAPESLILFIPFLVLASFSQYKPYIDTMFLQYAALTAPIVFIAAIRGYRRLHIMKKNLPKLNLRRFTAFLILLNLILALLFTPAGNLVSNNLYNEKSLSLLTGNSGIYDTNQVISPNLYASSINEMLSLIPRGTTVMAQNNFPQLAQGHVLVMPSQILDSAANILPDYVLVDPYNSFFQDPVFPGTPHEYNAMNAFNYLYSSGNYGIKAESGGIILLELYYTGFPVLFEPLHYDYSLNNLKVPTDVRVLNQTGVLYVSNLTGGTAWYGPYITLAPGIYRVTLSLQSEGLTSNDSMIFQISSFDTTSANTTIIGQEIVNAASFAQNGSGNLTLSLDIHQYLLNVEFRGMDAYWSTPLSLTDLSIKQIGLA